jgi:L-threonine-O-3-phosphate decarboxylase
MSRPVHGGNLVWAAGLAQCSSRELLDFSASISPLGPPPSVCEAIQAAFSSVVAYPDPDYGELRGAIAHHHNIPTNYVLPGNGAAELLTWAARDLSQKSSICFQASPNFSDYDRALKAFDCKVQRIPLLSTKGWNLESWDATLLKDFSQNSPQEIDLQACGLLLNNPHNPTGALLTRQRVRALLARFGTVVVDEAFMDFLPPEREQSVIDWVDEFPGLVVLRSLTKFYSMPGVRLGYVIAQPETLHRWGQWRDPWSVNTLAAAAGIAAIQDIEFQRQTWAWLDTCNAQLYEGLSALPGLQVLPSAANFFLVACECSATELQRQMLVRHRIYIRDCISFEDLGDRYFRVAVKTSADNQRLLDALADLLPDLLKSSNQNSAEVNNER